MTLLLTHCGRPGPTSVTRVSQKNDNDVLRYNFNAHQPIFYNFWQRYCWINMLLNGYLLSHLS